MSKPGIRETLVDYYWAICFSLAALAMLLAVRFDPPEMAELSDIRGTVERVAPVRLGLSHRVAQLTVSTNAGREHVFVDVGRIARGVDNPRYRALINLIGEDVTLGVAIERSTSERFAYEIAARGQSLLSLQDATFWNRLRYQIIVATAVVLLLTGFYCLHLRFGAYHTRRRRDAQHEEARSRLAFLVETR